MSQVWNLPIDATDTLSASRTDLNDAFDALRTTFLGGSDPGSLVDGQIWVNTTTGKLRGRASAASFDIGDWGVSNLGHVRKDGTIPLTANWDVGAFKITNLGTPTAGGDAATKTYADLKVAKAGDTMTGLLTLSGDPTSALHAATKQYADLKVAKAGDTMTGRLTYSSPPASGANDMLSKTEIQDLATFNISTGHNHDGTNSRLITKIENADAKVEVSGLNINLTPLNVASLINVGGGGFSNVPIKFQGAVVCDTRTETINASGVVSAAGVKNVKLIPNSGTADDLDTLSSPVDGQELILSTNDATYNITVREVGNILLQASGTFSINSLRRSLTLRYLSLDSKWHEIARAA